MKNAKHLSLLLLVVPVVFLPGCNPVEWARQQFASESTTVVAGKDLSGDTSEVLVSIDGKPVITVASFEKEFDKVLQENPQLKSILPFMPDIKKNFLNGLVNQELVDHWVVKNNIDSNIDYKQEMDRMLEQVKRMVNTKFFSDAYPAEVTPAEVKEFYEKNKDVLPDLLISRGGVQTKAIMFDKEDAAQDFLKKVREVNDIDKAAKAAGNEKNVRDFKMVHPQSIGIDVALRGTVVDLKKLPSAGMIKGDDGKFWVYNATEREETKYQPFERVQAGLEQHVLKEKRMKAIEKAIEGLKKDYTVEINEEYFKKQDEAAAKAAKEAAEKMKRNQQAAQKKAAVDQKAAQPAAPVARTA